MIDGIKIIESPWCMETVWNFPKSKNRSARQHKKLLKRYGVQSFQRPGAFMISGALNVHPEVLKKMMEDKRIIKL